MMYDDKKIDILLTALDMDLEEFSFVFSTQDEAPGICMNSDCEFITDVKPNEKGATCEECGTLSVTSGLVLLGVAGEE